MTLIRSPFPSLPCGLIALAAMSSALLSQESRPVNPGNPSTIEDFQAVDASREPYQRATDLLAAIQVSAEDWVADVGAGAGYYSMRLADLVGAEGRVGSPSDVINSVIDEVPKETLLEYEQPKTFYRHCRAISF